jgi:hypothetical protein
MDRQEFFPSLAVVDMNGNEASWTDLFKESIDWNFGLVFCLYSFSTGCDRGTGIARTIECSLLWPPGKAQWHLSKLWRQLYKVR